jgi:predicted GH43/DUF377 family glycosyl hydrolase
MKWLKHGKIFNPLEYSLPSGCVQFAQSPQTLIFDDFVRFYFSTRALDTHGKFLSHVAFVDMKKNLRDVIRVSEKPVILLGDLGCFDEHGIFPMNVIRHNNAIYAYTCGWNRRVSVSVDTAIGLAISHDGGETFQRYGNGPVLSASLHEPCLVGDGFVKIIDGIFHMWYIFGTGWKKYVSDAPPDRTYKIGHATSKNGIDWMKEEASRIIPDRLGPDESQALPTVINIQDQYHMFFCYRESFDFRNNKERGYKIGHAISHDLITWIRDEDPFSSGIKGEWDSEMQCYPHAFELDKKTYIVYNGNEFGKYGFGLAELIQ